MGHGQVHKHSSVLKVSGLGRPGSCPTLAGVREEEGGFSQDVAAGFALVDLIHTAEPSFGVVEFEQGSRLSDRCLVRPFNLDEGGEVRLIRLGTRS